MNYPVDICLAGATGLVGHELLLILSQIDQVKEVKALSRSPLGRMPTKVENFLVNFDQIENQQEALKAQVYICCLGTTIKEAGSQEAFQKVDLEYALRFAKIAEKAGAKKFLVISAMGADTQSKVFYNRIKGQMERDLYKLNIPQIEIFRPSLILGQRKKPRAMEALAQKISPALDLLFWGPLKKYRGIQAKDIAKAMALAAMSFEPGRYLYQSDEIQEMANSIQPDKDDELLK